MLQGVGGILLTTRRTILSLLPRPYLYQLVAASMHVPSPVGGVSIIMGKKPLWRRYWDFLLKKRFSKHIFNQANIDIQCYMMGWCGEWSKVYHPTTGEVLLFQSLVNDISENFTKTTFN